MSRPATARIDRSTPAARAARTTTLVVLGLLFLVPFYLLVRGALSSDADITSPQWKFVPSTIRWSNLTELFDDPAVPMLRSLLNSVVIAVVQTAGVLVLSALAGYGLARIPYRHANKVLAAILLSLLIPASVTFVPSFVLVSTLRWLDTLRGIIVPGLFQAFATFLFRQYFLGFPAELEEAGRIDGLGYWGSFWRIVVPNSLPIFGAVGALTFISSWNAFLWPLIVAKDPSSWTVQLAVSSLLTAQSINLHELFMASVVSIAPLLLAFLFLQRYIVAGVERSGISE